MATAIKSTCPHRDDSPEFATVCDWLAANGIDELIPEDPTFMVIDDRIVYRAFQFKDGQRGHDPAMLADAHLRLLEEDRTVPLQSPVTDEVRAAFDALESRESSQYRSFLVEIANGGTCGDNVAKADAYRRRLGHDDSTPRIQLLSNSGPSRKCLSLTARNGAIHIKVGDDFIKDEDATTDAFVLDAHRIDGLAETLPKLKAWLKSER